MLNMYNQSIEMVGDIEKTSRRNTEPTLYHIRDNRGNPVIQILDMMGAFLFEPNNNENDYPFPPLINKTINCPNRKIWLQVIEPAYMDSATRERYVLRVECLHDIISTKDKHIILLNKIDKYHASHTSSKNSPDVIKLVDSNYPRLLSIYKNTHPISLWFHKYNCAVVPFCTGYYYEVFDKEWNPQVNGTPSNDIFPAMLWKVIKKMVHPLNG